MSEDETCYVTEELKGAEPIDIREIYGSYYSAYKDEILESLCLKFMNAEEKYGSKNHPVTFKYDGQGRYKICIRRPETLVEKAKRIADDLLYKKGCDERWAKKEQAREAVKKIKEDAENAMRERLEIIDRDNYERLKKKYETT